MGGTWNTVHEKSVETCRLVVHVGKIAFRWLGCFAGWICF